MNRPNEITMSPLHHTVRLASTSICIDSATYLVPKCRSGKDLWKIVRIKMLSYKTQQRLLQTSVGNGRRLSIVCESVARILQSESERATLRRLKYGSSLEGLLRQLFDECLDWFFAFIKSIQNPGKHAPWFTMCMVAVYVAIFAFMASEWAIVLEKEDWVEGPHNIFRYLVPNSQITQFSNEFLIVWGAQNLHLIVNKNQSYRWIASPFLHVSIVHCMSNMIMYIFFGTVVERTYGPLVAIVIWFTAATMGCFMAGACGEPCVVLVGASGSVFGYFGFFCIDTGLRWNVIKRPAIRIMFIVMFTAQAIYSIVSDHNISYWAHIGGCLGGMCCSTLLLKHLKRRRRIFVCVVGTTAVVLWIVFPVVVYSTNARYKTCV